ncbi:hypothetical protein A3Q56_05249 [Intoshia linei]|uniref:W2 domain-containing protein n=1 Tax=Intoshia linei TaxID=1819745 RepID=A0A177AYF9_9BILA|nr:hypothetical protein A3Q56_05249 [Intoshia linei]
MRKQTTPLIDWLQNASEESSEEKEKKSDKKENVKKSSHIEH